MKIEKNLLVINDPTFELENIAKNFHQYHLIFTSVSDQEAIELLQTEQIVAVILNMGEEIPGSYEFLKKTRYSRFKVPILVTATESDEELKAFSLGATDFVRKPYCIEVMVYRIAHLIQLSEITNRSMGRDSLTGLYSKDTFYKKAELQLRDTKSEFDILSIDIERFKLINDTYGVSVGDDLLRYIAEKMESYFEREDGFCARMSGDQFVVLCPRGESYIDKIIQRAKQDLDNYPLDMKLTIKFGIYQIDDRSIPIAAMCDRAILAARNIKGKYGEHYAFYDDSIRKRLLLEQMIVDTMKDALEQAQFHVYMQPKYDLTTGKIAGAEALVRWLHPERGLLSPDTFIPLFERNGFITELDHYVWDKTCAFLAEHIEKTGNCVPISVNVSRVDVYNPNLPEILCTLVRKYKLDPQYLHLEITETAYTENQDQLIAVVNCLKELGFIIEMDDFGTGYSSLSMLSELPIDVLKLDMSLIQRKPEQNHNILSFIISLAKWMKLLVVAEGVETGEQVDLLRNMDCDYVQGYYYARPLPSEDFSTLLAQEEERIHKGP